MCKRFLLGLLPVQSTNTILFLMLFFYGFHTIRLFVYLFIYFINKFILFILFHKLALGAIKHKDPTWVVGGQRESFCLIYFFLF